MPGRRELVPRGHSRVLGESLVALHKRGPLCPSLLRRACFPGGDDNLAYICRQNVHTSGSESYRGFGPSEYGMSTRAT